jgi:WD40 repeat protein
MERTLLGGHVRSVLALGFLPDGRTLVSASPDGTVRFWETVPDRQGGWGEAVVRETRSTG